MAAEILIQDAAGSTLSPIVFGVDANLNPADDATNYTDDVGTDTADVVLTLSGVASAAGRQSTKTDLGAVRAERYAVFAAIDFTGETPTDGQTVDFYWLPSTNGTEATANVAGNSGVDAAAPGGALGAITLAQMVLQADFIGALVVHDGAGGGGGVVQNGPVGVFAPSDRYGQLLVVNSSGDAFEADNVEHHVALYPIVPESQ